MLATGSVALLSAGLAVAKLWSWGLIRAIEYNPYASGNDSNLYHRFAVREQSAGGNVNIWPGVLRALNDVGLYDRTTISFLLLALTVTILPLILAGCLRPTLGRRLNRQQRRTRWMFVLFVIAYPSLFLFSLDLYRDPVIVCLFALGTYFATFVLQGRSWVSKAIGALFFAAVSYLAFGFRNYLGVAMVLSLPLALVFDARRTGAVFLVPALLLSAAVVHSAGWLDPLLLYRGEFGFERGSTSFGIGIAGSSTTAFLGLWLLSIAYQVLGLYVTSPLLGLLFLLESVPILIMLKGIVRQRFALGRTAIYVLTFVTLYTAVWTLGNDNMGTALRLRIPTYVGIALAWALARMDALEPTKVPM